MTAEGELERDYVALEQMGEKYYLSTTAGYLAAALLQQGRDDEADEFTAISERLAAPNDISSSPFGEPSAAGCSLAMGSLKRARRW